MALRIIDAGQGMWRRKAGDERWPGPESVILITSARVHCAMHDSRPILDPHRLRTIGRTPV
jgi:hypothetical protein